ncbi:uncharacterized protein PV09_09077 [Verruconis gallopava]|uniref:Glutamine amidotransferase type-2 domain-containing protein n=1 Tax=Verruconis gallopava TaxID=253628 RepID=A0A0D2AJU2_9PEZI|nr:uncharacterized protein PV09_09077 [Verruconis gallopava]KIV99213.1 hypothetical protein PV09_09077 [Verruconis gallopava]
MCGIYCEIRAQEPITPSHEMELLLRQRGPDHYGCIHESLIDPNETAPGLIRMTFAASVLGLRHDEDDKPVLQPLELSGDLGWLCWNGEAWKYDGKRIAGSDTRFIAERLSEVSGVAQDLHKKTIQILSKIRGPFAFVYFSRPNSRLYFGRDYVGRRSLLWSRDQNGSLFLSSVAMKTISAHWEEVEADGIYSLEITKALLSDFHAGYLTSFASRTPYVLAADEEEGSITVPWSCINTALPPLVNDAALSTAILSRLHENSCAVSSLLKVLTASIELRLPDRLNLKHPPVAILFSGGLDCTLLARLAHECLHHDTMIDLLNVAFENPRVHKKIGTGTSPYEACPDRITARQSLAELRKICPNRCFNLVCINVPFEDSMRFRGEISALIHPHDTEMDISIAMALFFAARGPTQSKFLLSGLGADELFGGYQRHALAYRRGGYSALLQELQLDVDRLGKRNLGRDDRVISRWGKEARYPYLDEGVIAWAMNAPIWEKVGFGFAQTDNEEGLLEHAALDDKLILRCIAKKLGMANVAEEKKRAIQFGSRSAKMESGRTKGSEKIC